MMRFVLLVIFVVAIAPVFSQVQNPLDVQLKLPAYVRNGDKIELPVIFKNGSNKEINGEVQLQVFDPVKQTSIDGWLNNFFPFQYFNVDNTTALEISFPLVIPMDYSLPFFGWRLLVNKDTLQKGKLVVMEKMKPVNTLKKLQFTKNIFLINGNKQQLIKDQTTILVGDTLLVNLSLRSPGTLKNVMVKDDVPSNTRMLDENQNTEPAVFKQTFSSLTSVKKQLNYKLVVTHAGTASLPVTRIFSGKNTATFSNPFLLRTSNR